MRPQQLYFEQETPDFKLIGISCHQKDYKAAWAVCNALGIELEKMDDWEVLIHKKTDSIMAAFSYYTALIEDECYAFVANFNEYGSLLPELSQFDYFLLTWANHRQEMEDEIISLLRNNSLIQYCDYFNPSEFKYWYRLPGKLEQSRKS